MVETRISLAKHGHPDFVLSYDSSRVIDPDIRWLSGYLEAAVAEGEVFEPNETIQVGWLLLKVLSAGPKSLCLAEPVWGSLPFKWRRGVETTLIHLRMQKDSADSVDLLGELSFPSCRQSAIVCSRLGSSSGLILERSEPTGENDSGWYLGCDAEAHDHNESENLTCISLYEATLREPRSIAFLALPAETSVHVSSTLPEIFFKGEPRTIANGSFLAAQHGA